MKKYLYYVISLLLSIIILSCQNEVNSPTEENSGFNKFAGSALEFDGSTGYVEIPDNPSLDVSGGITIAAWIWISSYTEWASILTKGGYFGAPDDDILDNNYTIHQSGPSGHLRFTGPADYPFGVPESNTQIPLNEWHHIVVSFNGTSVKFYLDGYPDGETVVTGPLTPNSNALRFGVDTPGGDEYWHGKIDEVVIWNEALSVSQIRILTRGSATPRVRSIVGFWRFNEGRGTIVRDRSPYNNDGTLNGGVGFVSPGAP